MHRSLAWFIVTIVLAWPNCARGVVVVNWGGNYVSSDQSLNGAEGVIGFNVDPLYRDNRVDAIAGQTGDNLTDDSLQGRAFSTTTAFNPQTGYSGTSGTFYGGAVRGLLNTTTLDPFNTLQIQNHGPQDTIDVRYQASNTASELEFAVYWKKADFLNGGASSSTITIDSSSVFSVTFATNTSSQVTNSGELRWIVEADGQWWISAADSDGTSNIISKLESSSGGINNRTTYTSSGAAGELTYWAPYNPLASSGYDMNFEPQYDPETNTGTNTISYNVTAGTFSAHTFTNITSVGLYIEDDQFTTNVMQFSIESISFNLAIVPEPASLALLTAALCGIAWGAVRRRRSPRSE